MKKKILYILIALLTLMPNMVLAAQLDYVACGNSKGIPAPVPQLISIVYTLLIVGTPIILIIFSIVALLKAITGGSQDDINKAKNKVIKKFIAAALVFFVAGVVQFAVVRASDVSEKQTVVDCIRCMLYNNGCMPSDGGEDAYHATTRPGQSEAQVSNPTGNTNNNNGNNNTPSTNVATSAIFVGDSRTVGICQYNNTTLNVGKCRDYLTVSQGGMGYKWFKNTAISSVDSLLNQNSSTTYNIVILLGVNDISNTTYWADNAVNEYMTSLKTLASGNWKKHNIIFTSVTRIEGTTTGGDWPVTQTNIDYFNSQMKSQIASAGLSNFTYCDINSGLDLNGKIAGDKIHYTGEGYTTVYNQVVSKCL